MRAAAGWHESAPRADLMWPRSRWPTRMREYCGRCSAEVIVTARAGYSRGQCGQRLKGALKPLLPRLRRVSCVTLMVNRSDRRFQTLSPRMAARGRETDQPNEARGNPSRPGLHLTPDKQAGYMTATEFQIAPAIQPLTRAGSIYGWRSGMDSNPHIWTQPRSQAARSTKVKPVA